LGLFHPLGWGCDGGGRASVLRMRDRAGSSGRGAILGVEVAILIGLVLVSWGVVNSTLMTLQPGFVAVAVLVDMTLTAAVCHYLLGVRLGGLLAWTIIPVMILGVITSRLLLPAHIGGDGVLPLVGVAIIECTVLLLVVLRIRTIRRGYLAATRAGAEGFDALEAGFLALAPSMPLLAAWARLEAQLWSLFFVGWAFKRRPAEGPNVFTHHRQSHWFTILGVLLFLVLMEGGLVHWWLHSSGHTVAKWVVFALHFYGVVWLVGDMQAARLYRSSLVINDGVRALDVRIGLRGSARVPLSNIAGITIGSWDRAGEGEGLIALQGTANVKLSFTECNVYKPVLGAPKFVGSLLIYVDEPDGFKQMLQRSAARTEVASSS